MFRRKEDSLFDTDTDFNAEDNGESATVVTPQAATSAATAAPVSSYASSATSAATTSSVPAQPARPIPEARPNATAAGTANSFRSSAAPISDMNRNRMPEAKPVTPVAAAASSFVSERPAKTGARVLTVGNDILLKGEIASCDRLVIEGKVDATVNDVHTVEIAENGSFKGIAQVEDAEISGLFEGDLTVRGRLVIYATGKVRGKISYGEIEIQRGGELTGEIKLAGQSSATASRPARAAAAPKDAKEAVAA